MMASGPGLAAVSAHEVPGIPAPDSFVIQSRHPVENERVEKMSELGSEVISPRNEGALEDKLELRIEAY